ncbi:Reticulon-4-interacting protein 1, mitochondrial [Armadillidium nasatum]|uniref:Reticulon-4-interacting protein 1, mitochondrial n=1 Tax=Armadillidium nasatum TaxID=96803 RepID=A0A5N5SIZ2_9CRUS|nr:Reticulon-4-interacting protein 1, mitochondrial [Armadillidium nasatum]
MNPSYFHHHLLLIKKIFIQRGFNHNTFLYLGSNLKKNASHIFSSTVPKRSMNTETMKSWQATTYGLENLKLSSIDIPSILKPNEVLVKVCAASVNPLDVLMLDKAYGRSTFELLNYLDYFGDVLKTPNLPLTGGRDFVGEVVRVGHSVSNIEVNDKVWGVVMPHRQGSHAEYVVTSDFLISKKPENISDIEAASLPYIGMTAWNTVVSFGNLSQHHCKGLKIGLVGANGGIGTFLTQLFHLLIDAAGISTGDWCETLLMSRNSTIISLKSPLLTNIDENGALFGSMKTLAELVKVNTVVVPDGVKIKWSFFYPNKEALQNIGKLLEEGKIRPIIDKVFKMEDLLSAYEHVKSGRKQGKTVIDFTS